MIRSTVTSALLAVVAFSCHTLANAQDVLAVKPGELRTLSPYSALQQIRAANEAARLRNPATASSSSLAVFPYSFVSPRDGKTYTGTLVGSDPRASNAGTTQVEVVLIPLELKFTGGTTTATFDPTAPDVGCLGPNTAVTLTQASPVFTPVPNFLINGVNMGTATYPDAVQRASYWSDAAGNPLVSAKPAYHLDLPVKVSRKVALTVSTANGTNGALMTVPGTCSTNTVGQVNPPLLGVININYLDPKLNTIIAKLKLNPSQFPFFVIYGAVISSGKASNQNNCCILGYHSSSGNAAAPGQTYGISEYDQGYVFGPAIQDVAALSHEVSEWINDPSGGNLAPPWGNIGQVGGCQNNTEDGDPLSGTLMPAITMANNVTYHPQELVYFSWLMGPVFNGAGGVYSTNVTFKGDAKACPPGGTN